MMKFWKSAAKGKSGCPVRPPEASTSSNKFDFRTLLDFHQKELEQDDMDYFEKKSKLNISLHEILKSKKAINYFSQYLETIGQYFLMKCWLEIEQFRSLVIAKETENFVDGHTLTNTVCDLQDNQSDVRERREKIERELKANFKSHSRGHKVTKTQSLDLSKSCDHLHIDKTSPKLCDVTEKAIFLFKAYVALEAPHKLIIPDSVRKDVITNICQPKGQIKEDCFKQVEDIVFGHLKKHFKEFQKSPLYVKAQIDILTSDSLTLKDILYNESILFYFTEYVEQESCSILLEFLITIMNFRDNLIMENTKNKEQIESDAIVLYERYFSLQATNPIGFPCDIRLKVESDICREEGPLPNCFDLPFRIVFRALSYYVKTFLESEVYYKYLSEMIHSVDERWLSHHKSHSDCSSEYSVSTQNTLLAMGDSAFERKKRNHSVPDMTIDSNQLYNADALWRRKRNEGLSLGRINSLGRFESKLEPDPDKKDKSVLKKMVSKFVPSNTKVEEEMAWQIAHMIVKDVTDLTMAPPENQNI